MLRSIAAPVSHQTPAYPARCTAPGVSSSLENLDAFSPTGLSIVSLLEGGLGTHSVLSFERIGKSAEPTYGDQCEMPLSEAILKDRHLVYVDEAGTYWHEPALTLKDDEGKIIRQGHKLPPLVLPSVPEAMQLAAKVK